MALVLSAILAVSLYFAPTAGKGGNLILGCRPPAPLTAHHWFQVPMYIVRGADLLMMFDPVEDGIYIRGQLFTYDHRAVQAFWYWYEAIMYRKGKPDPGPIILHSGVGGWPDGAVGDVILQCDGERIVLDERLSDQELYCTFHRWLQRAMPTVMPETNAMPECST